MKQKRELGSQRACRLLSTSVPAAESLKHALYLFLMLQILVWNSCIQAAPAVGLANEERKQTTQEVAANDFGAQVSKPDIAAERNWHLSGPLATPFDKDNERSNVHIHQDVRPTLENFHAQLEQQNSISGQSSESRNSDDQENANNNTTKPTFATSNNVIELSAFEAAKRGYFRHSMLTSVILTIAYTIVFIIGIVGNSFVVAIVCKSPRMRTVTNYFIVNLAFADILVLLFCLPATLVGNLFIRKYTQTTCLSLALQFYGRSFGMTGAKFHLREAKRSTECTCLAHNVSKTLFTCA